MVEWYWILATACVFTVVGYAVACFAFMASDNEPPRYSSSEWNDVIATDREELKKSINDLRN